MADSNPGTRPKRRKGKVLLVSLVSLIAATLSWELAWTYSGSNTWKLESDANGVKVYSMKSPGSRLKKYRGVRRVNSSLSAIVGLLTDPDLCRNLGGSNCKIMNRVEGPDSLTYYSVSRFEFPLNIKTREFVNKESFVQDPQSKIVSYEILAVPDAIPPDACCVRVAYMDNTWRFTPIKNSEVEVEYIVDADDGGSIPFLLQNFGHSEAVSGYLSDMQKALDKEKYKNAKLNFILEQSDN
jgi:hypothetical protein